MIYAQNSAHDILIKLCIVKKKTDNPTQINAVVMPAKNCFVVMKERKKRRNRFVATGPSEYYSGGLFIFVIVRRAGLSLSHAFRR